MSEAHVLPPKKSNPTEKLSFHVAVFNEAFYIIYFVQHMIE